MNRAAYVPLVFDTPYGYRLSVSRSGAVYYSEGLSESVRRADHVPTRAGLLVTGPDGHRFTVTREGRLIDHAKENENEEQHGDF